MSTNKLRRSGGLGSSISRQSSSSYAFPTRPPRASRSKAPQESPAPEASPSIATDISFALMQTVLDPASSMQTLAALAGAQAQLGRAFHQAAQQRRQSAATVSQAVVALGLLEAQALALLYATATTLEELDVGMDIPRALERMVRRGACAERIARELDIEDLFSVFAAGVLCDIGTFLLARRLPYLSTALDALHRYPSSARRDAERLIGGKDHIEELLSSPLGEQLPEPVRTAIEDHHTLDTDSTLAQIVYVADRLSDALAAPESVERAQAADDALAELLSTSRAKLLDGISDRIHHLASPIDLQLSSPNTAGRKKRSGLAMQPVAHRGGQRIFSRMLSPLRFRRSLEQALATLRMPCSLLVLNIDNFQQLNDAFGHPAGDAVIRVMLENLESCIREEDTIGRLGGDCFAVVMHRTGQTGGQVVAERLRSMVEKTHMHFGESRVSCSVSLFGFAIPPTNTKDVETLMAELLEGLDRSRWVGRNRVGWTVLKK